MEEPFQQYYNYDKIAFLYEILNTKVTTQKCRLQNDCGPT